MSKCSRSQNDYETSKNRYESLIDSKNRYEIPSAEKDHPAYPKGASSADSVLSSGATAAEKKLSASQPFLVWNGWSKSG